MAKTSEQPGAENKQLLNRVLLGIVVSSFGFTIFFLGAKDYIKSGIAAGFAAVSGACATYQCQREANQWAESLTKQIDTTQPLDDLARNPLLITMIAATHRVETQLPSRKVDLYHTICELLLWKRLQVKGMSLTLSRGKNQALLQLLAWNLLWSEQDQFEPRQGEEWIREEFDRCKTEDFTIDDFWAEIKNISGLLSEKHVGYFEFTHKTFQEYFAALYLRDIGGDVNTILLD